MIKCLIFIVATSSLFFSNNRCLTYPEQSRTRPSLETFYLSENSQFKIHYDLEGHNAPDLADLNNNSVPDYVEEVASIAEESRYVLINVMGYIQEPDDGDGIYDIYIVNQSAWGWNVPESASTGASYVKIDNDYIGNSFNSSFCYDPIDKMKISVAHEFFHAIQRAYRPNYNTDHDFLLEMSSMWFEDLMVDNCNDYLSFTNYSSGIFKIPDQKFEGSESANSASFGYSMALFAHYLSKIVDPQGVDDQKKSNIIRLIWEDYQNQSNQDDVNAAGQSIINVIADYQKSFAEVWSDFIARNMFSGFEDFFNENLYYYQDQQYMSPLTFTYPSNSISIDYQDVISIPLNPYSANIYKIYSLDQQLVNLDYVSSGCSSDVVSLLGDDNLLLDLQSLSSTPIEINQSDIMYFISTQQVPDCEDVNVDISTENIPSDQVAVYPNPIYYNGHINIDIDTYSNIDDLMIEIFDIKGELVLKENNIQIKSPITVNLNQILKASGIYFISISYNQKKTINKFAYIK